MTAPRCWLGTIALREAPTNPANGIRWSFLITGCRATSDFLRRPSRASRRLGRHWLPRLARASNRKRRNARPISAQRKSAIVGASGSLIIIVGAAHGDARARQRRRVDSSICGGVVRNTRSRPLMLACQKRRALAVHCVSFWNLELASKDKSDAVHGSGGLMRSRLGSRPPQGCSVRARRRYLFP